MLPNTYFFQNPNTYRLNAFQNQGANNYGFPATQIPGLPFPHAPSFQNVTFAPPMSQVDPKEVLGRIETTVAKAHHALLESGESISAWKVSQSAMLSLGVNSWGSMGLPMQDIPYLRRLMITEGKVDAFIHCFVGSRRITTVHDLDTAICTAEAVDRFDELGLGMLERHSLVRQYFSIPPEVTDVLQITTEEIIKSIGMLIEKGKRNITEESVIKFLMEKYSVNLTGKLGVRIQNLGSYITHIRESKKAENARLHASLESLSQNSANISDSKLKAHTSSLTSVKSVMNKRFESISERMKSFSSSWKDNGNTHIRFDLSDDDDHDKVTVQEFQEQTLPQRVSSCPYPSTTEELTRLGMKSVTSQTKSPDNRRSRQADIVTPQVKKRKTESSRELDIFFQELKQRKVNFYFPSNLEKYFKLHIDAMKKFIQEWKEACNKCSVLEVLKMMSAVYEDEDKKKKRKRLCSVLKTFSAYPGIALLNIAVTCIKHGMLDGLCDSLYCIEKNNISNSRCVEATSLKKCYTELEVQSDAVSASDIIHKISSYTEGYQHIFHDREMRQKSSAVLQQLDACEKWLVEQYSVVDFRTLGHGSFLGFLNENISRLSVEAHGHSSRFSQKPSLVISMLQDQLLTFLSQAEHHFSELDNIPEHILLLLRKQFPTVSFHVQENQPEELLSHLKQISVTGEKSESVIFSSTLLNGHQAGNSSFPNEHSPPSIGVKCDSNKGFLFSDTEDVLKCLSKAPMLADLRSWSHWDILYAPKLGALLDWLLNVVNNKELVCIATSDGKFIRIDPAPSVDDFLEAAIQGSSFQTALKLLSLLSLYGGTSGFPLSLVKHLAQSAMEVKIRNSGDGSTLNTMRGASVADFGSEVLCVEKCQLSEVSHFILNCLWYFPHEFRSFAADILVSGLRSIVNDAYLVILQECNDIDYRLMLHDIGLSLGIIEWIEDYNLFCSSDASDMKVSKVPIRGNLFSAANCGVKSFCSLNDSEVNKLDSSPTCVKSLTDLVGDQRLLGESLGKEPLSECKKKPVVDGHTKCEIVSLQDAVLLIESIRREEFGLDTNFQHLESHLLDKQHARLGRALQCLSQELYSHDSHLLLELIQNADDNSYPECVNPTLVFILEANGIVLLNNESGFSAENIRALCDIGNSTKGRSNSGYIGHKGIGFKSVFRITDAPEIHSNGFHVKFDITKGQIGFVLPTIVSPCDANLYAMQIPCDDQADSGVWNTCIVLPFRSKIKEQAEMNSVTSLFSDLHPSLLLFLHKLQCIQYKNVLRDTFMVMRKETLKEGIIRVSKGAEKMTWLVVSEMLKVKLIRNDVETTEIALAFTLQESESGNGEYKPHLYQQPVFAFLPLRHYGLKFILQGDFVLPSSREEVDGDSAWNQWLLSQYPALFVGAAKYFCKLSCFKESPGKAVSIFLSFVPLPGEVYGFFAPLPSMIVSKLRTMNCLMLEGDDMEWVLPCRALMGWDEQARFLVPDNLLKQHLGLGYLRKDIIVPDTLAKSLGVRCYGPLILVDMIKSLCQVDGGAMSLGFDWLASCLVALQITLATHSNTEREIQLLKMIKDIPFIPLSDGSYCSLAEGPIWLPCEYSSGVNGGRFVPNAFPHLYSKLRTVDPNFLAAEMSYIINEEEKKADNLTRILLKVGVQQLFSHEVIKTHILNELARDRHSIKERQLTIEYLSFVMLHFQYDDCLSCSTEKDILLSELKNSCVVLTNHGFKCPIKEPIHFSKEYGNQIDINRLIDHDDAIWNVVDNSYLEYPSTQSLTSKVKHWRDFFLTMGLTDFVQVVHIRRNMQQQLSSFQPDACHDTSGLIVGDWESPELTHFLSVISAKKNSDRSQYLLEVLDSMWDNYYAGKTVSCTVSSCGIETPVQSSFLNSIRNIKWISSCDNDGLNFAKDLYHDCEAVRSLLGSFAPYAVPQVKSKTFLMDIGFKTHVALDDALKLLQRWSGCSTFSASTAQMSKFYQFLYDNASAFNEKRLQELTTPWIFVPFVSELKIKIAMRGSFFFPEEVYWQDPIGCFDQVQEMIFLRKSGKPKPQSHCKALARVYPGLHNFFVSACGVQEIPHLANYMEILLDLSKVASPLGAGSTVYRVLSKWANDFNSGILKPEKLLALKEFLCMSENTILPTVQDRWVSLHSKFGLICWCDDEELKVQIQCADNNIDLLYLGESSNLENSNINGILPGKLTSLLQYLGVPALSEIVFREAIFYGTSCNQEKMLLLNWILPYAQRYIFKLYPSIYRSLVKTTQDKLNQLQVFVVEKLFYTYKVKGHDINFKKRYECKCLLQGNILYVAHSSDSHSMFLEMSRLLFNGSVNLQLANFLHMISTMTISGSDEKQIEIFIVNNQKIPELPSDEPRWMLRLASTLLTSRPMSDTVEAGDSSKANVTNPSTRPNWTATDWRHLAVANFSYQFGQGSGMVSTNISSMRSTKDFCGNMNLQMPVATSTMEASVSMDADGVGAAECKPNPFVLQDLTDRVDQVHSVGLIDGQGRSDMDLKTLFCESFTLLGNPSMMPTGFHTTQERLNLTSSNEMESHKTGRLGEAAAYRYFSERLGPVAVKWVNKDVETGLPYDLLIGEGDDREYIEVKTTRSKVKNWFSITTREWQLAVDKEDAFSIARVILHDNDEAEVVVLKNPVKLLQKNMLHLAILMS